MGPTSPWRVSRHFTAPWWPIKLVIFLSATLCALLFTLKAFTKAIEPELIKTPEHEDTP